MKDQNHLYLSWIRANILLSSVRDKLLVSGSEKYPEEFVEMIRKLDVEVKEQMKRLAER